MDIELATVKLNPMGHSEEISSPRSGVAVVH